MATQWLVTDEKPGGWRAEPVGWKLHAVEAKDTDTPKIIKVFRAACGLRARYGWTIDLYIPDEPRYRCKRCVRALAPTKAQMIDELVALLAPEKESA